MMRNSALAVARKLASKLPEKAKRRIRTATAPLQYSRNTRGLGTSASMTSWARDNGRPVSIVIPSYNDLPYLRACLASIQETCGYAEHEVIIVDDFCEPANARELKALESSTVSVILKDKREGFSAAVNRGMAEARHDVILLNSDIVAKPGWLEALQYSAYAIDDHIGLVSPKLVYPSGRIQYGGTYYARLLAPQWFGHLHVGSAATRPVANVASYNRSISGACVYITRRAFDALGFLDERFWLGFEDVDYGLRAWSLGIRCYYQPAAMLIHHESASRGYSQGSRELASMRYFWRRWDRLFLSRTVVTPPAVDYVVSDVSSELWKQYVREQSDSLRAMGHDVDIHEVPSNGPDNSTIERLAGRSSIKICCDWGANQTTWLASLEHGKAAYLLPSVESGRYPGDAVRQNFIVANYKPEYDYIAPNRWAADQLRAETAWESRGRVVPVLNPVAPLESGVRTTVVTLGADARQRETLDATAERIGCQVVHLDEQEPHAAIVEEVQRLGARVIVALAEYDNSLALLTLMSLGAALVARHNDKTRYEVLDGYNSLLVKPNDGKDIARAVTDIMTDDTAWQELRGNGTLTAERLSALNAREMSRVLYAIAENAV